MPEGSTINVVKLELAVRFCNEFGVNDKKGGRVAAPNKIGAAACHVNADPIKRSKLTPNTGFAVPIDGDGDVSFIEGDAVLVKAKAGLTDRNNALIDEHAVLSNGDAAQINGNARPIDDNAATMEAIAAPIHREASTPIDGGAVALNDGDATAPIDGDAAKIVPLKFKRNQNVKAIKGLAMKRLDPVQRKSINSKEIVVAINGKCLKDSDRLADLDFANRTVDVFYPGWNE